MSGIDSIDPYPHHKENRNRRNSGPAHYQNIWFHYIYWLEMSHTKLSIEVLKINYHVTQVFKLAWDSNGQNSNDNYILILWKLDSGALVFGSV